MSTIEAIHTAVEGRTRFKINGLNHSPEMKRVLEIRLSEHADVRFVSASIVTGNLLISYNSDNTPGTMEKLIERVIHETKAGLENAERVALAAAARQSRETGQTAMVPRSPAIPAVADDDRDWHLMHREAVLEQLSSDDKKGLTPETAAELLARYGPNTLPESEGRSGWGIFFDQINSLPVYLLGAAAGVSILTGGILDAAIIGGVVVANAAIGFVTESKAEKTIHSLKNMVRPTAEVMRDGEVMTVSSADVAPGDILILKPGLYVAADCRIVRASHLSIDESMLTGESMPASKSARTLKGDAIPLADRTNMAYMGTLVTGGQGIAVVTAVGRQTEIGRLQVLLQDTETPETPIERQLGQMGDQLVLMCGAVCGVVFLLGYLRGHGFLQMLRTAISLAAAAVPEGLPAAATINFAMGINRMRSHNVLIRHLQAVETLGAVQVVCLDKTGTITHNRMTVQRIFCGMERVVCRNQECLVAGTPVDPLKTPELRQLIITCFLCNETKINNDKPGSSIELFGTATENALIHLALDAGIDVQEFQSGYRRLKINHRAENRLFMSTLHADRNRQLILSVKGSPAEVLSMCTRQMVNGRIIPLTGSDRLAIETENEEMAGAALRVLGVAFRAVPNGDKPDESDLIWLGLVAMADPIRDGVAPLIKKFHTAGIKTVMITGDQSSTAYAVARDLELSGDDPLEILDSTQLSAVNPETLKALAKQAHVYARVSPSHKLEIVQAIQAGGKTVAMTGDGINDGPALKAANLGIAMGETGTDVARDVADVVLKTDNLEALTQALGDGRTIYSNIRKSVHFFLATNISEILLMLAAMGLNIGFPLNVMQLLWINIISDIFPGLALSMEAPEPGVMEKPPRDPQAPLFSRDDFMRQTGESAIITGGALAAYGFGILRYGMGANAASMAFQSLTFGQLLHAVSCRSERKSIFSKQRLPANPYLSWAIGGSLALQGLTLIFPPLRQLLGVTRHSLIDIAVIGGSAAAPLFINEATKHTRKK